MANVPLLVFTNGRTCPVIGLGTWKSKPGEVTQAVKDAIDIGYRHIDCALIYGNEKEVGEALKEKFDEGVVKREDMFITSKLWCTFHRPDLVEDSLKKSLQDLGLEYLDLYLVHWPQAYKPDHNSLRLWSSISSYMSSYCGGPRAVRDLPPVSSILCSQRLTVEGESLFPVDDQGKAVPSAVDYVNTWKAMEGLVDKGLVKTIGISNFNKRQIDRVMENSRIKPVVIQIEVHPYLNQEKLIEHCRSLGITVSAYSPLGSPDRPWAKPGEPQLLEDPRLKSIADRYNKSTAQVLIRYAIDRGLIVTPKSVTKSRIQQNFQVFDFQLSPEDIELIATFECNGRVCSMGDVHHPDFPFHDEY